MSTIKIRFDGAPMKYKPELGAVPFHLGCNAFVTHPNCALCNPRSTCVGCYYEVRPATPSDHARGCPTSQNGTPNYE